jgi:hypothetical protein|tara:strand:- start:12105 stop:12551 length:447 start_codon:yes stop_codon:yes gene_type:complete
MSGDVKGVFEVPVQKLMCSDVKMGSILTEPRPIHRKEMPLFLSLLNEVIERWYEGIGPMNTDIYATYNFHTELLQQIRESYEIIANDDSPSVFRERERLGTLMESFSDMLQSFAEVFVSPEQLKGFYYKILKRVNMTNNIILEGEYGW